MFKCLSLFLILFALSSRAATYYVTQSGSGSRNGTSAANSWSVGDFNGSDAAGGDTVIFSGTFSSSPAKSGSSGNPLTLDLKSATYTSTFTLNGKNYVTVLGGTTSPSQGSDCLSVSNSSGVTFDGWQFLGSNNTGGTTFVWLSKNNHITFKNCVVKNCGYGFGGDFNDDVLVSGCDVTSSQTTGGQTDLFHFGSAKNVTIEKCKLTLRAPGNWNIRHNDVIQCYRSGASGGYNCTNWVIRYNWVCLDVTSPASDGNASWTMLEALDGKPALKIYSNVFMAPPGGGGANNGVRDNKNPGSSDTHFLYGNTIIKRNIPGNVIIWLSPGTATWKNNILWSPSGAASGNPNSTMSTTADYNFFYRNGSSFTGSHGSGSTDPKLQDPDHDDYSLAQGSPCLGKGDNTIGAEYAYGIAPGSKWPNPTIVARTGAWDVGAFVGAAGGPPPQPTPTPSPTPEPTPKFATGDHITPTKTVNVRDTPSGTVIGTVAPGEIGQVEGGPEVKDLNGAPVNWYDTTWLDQQNVAGWAGDDNLTKTEGPAPTPTPAPTATPSPSPSASPTPPAGDVTYEKWIENQNNWIRANPPTPDQPK